MTMARVDRLVGVTMPEQGVSQLVSVDLEKAVEFSIKWPRGELGSLPADAEQFMLLEMVIGQVEKLEERLDNMMHNAVNIKRLQEDVKEARDNIEKLKDGQRILKNSNGVR